MNDPIFDQYAAMAPLDVCGAIGSRPHGLTDEEGRARLAAHGPNTISDLSTSSILGRLVRAFANWITGILLVAGAMAFVSATPLIGWTIVFVALLNGLFTTWQEHLAERSIAALRNLMPSATFVRRSGQVRKIPTAEIVPGDILPLQPGALVVADGLLIAGDGIRVRQGMLTGNSALVTKVPGALADTSLAPTERPNLVLAGSTVAEGQGSLLVVTTGMRTLLGRIAATTAALHEGPSPLARALNSLAATISRVAIAAGVLTFLLTTLIGRVDVHTAVIFAIGMIVAFVPEGLLPTVSLSLALARRRLQRVGVLVRRLVGVESLGSASVLCLDRSESLTGDTLAVRALWAPGQRAQLSGAQRSFGELSAAHRATLRAAALSANARLLGAGDEREGEPRLVGDQAERALLLAAIEVGAAPAEGEFDRIRQFPQEPRRPLTSVIGLEPALPPGEQAVYLRGAPAAVLERCTAAIVDGEPRPLSDELRQAALDEADALARQGMRVLALATRRMAAADPSGLRAREIEVELTLHGLVGLQEPPEPAIVELAEGCRQAGVRIVLVTGAYGLTAEASARRAGLIGAERVRIITGTDMDSMSDADLGLALTPGEEVIFAQCDAEQKRRVVAALRSRGEVVAFMGDSINDAPALKQADIGVAVAGSSTTVALASADLVLSGAKPRGLLPAIAEGRAIFSNIQRFAVYIFTHGVAEVVAVVAGAIAGLPLPLTVLQVLLIDVGAELLPAIALSGEPPEPEVMRRPPRPRATPLVDRALLLRSFAWLGLLEGALALIAYMAAPWAAGWRPGQPLSMAPETYMQATTLAYAAIVLGQIGVALAIRSHSQPIWQIGLLSNQLLLVSAAVSVALMLALIYTPPVAEIVGFVAPSAWQWALVGSVPLIMLAAEETRKLIARRATIARAQAA